MCGPGHSIRVGQPGIRLVGGAYVAQNYLASSPPEFDSFGLSF